MLILALACHRTTTDDHRPSPTDTTTVHTGENCGEPVPGGPAEYYTYTWGQDYSSGPYEEEGCWVEDIYPGCDAMFGATGTGECPDLDQFVVLSHWFDDDDPDKQLLLCGDYAYAFWRRWGAQQAAAFDWPERRLSHFVLRRAPRHGPWCCGGVAYPEVGYVRGSSEQPTGCATDHFVRDLTPDDFQR